MIWLLFTEDNVQESMNTRKSDIVAQTVLLRYSAYH